MLNLQAVVHGLVFIFLVRMLALLSATAAKISQIPCPEFRAVGN